MTREELFRAVGEVREDQIADAAEMPNKAAPAGGGTGPWRPAWRWCWQEPSA